MSTRKQARARRKKTAVLLLDHEIDMLDLALSERLDLKVRNGAPLYHLDTNVRLLAEIKGARS